MFFVPNSEGEVSRSRSLSSNKEFTSMKFVGLKRKKILWTVFLLSISVHVFGSSAADFQCSSEPTDQHRMKVFAMEFSLAEKKIENLVVTTQVLHRYDSVSPFVFRKKKLYSNVQPETLTIRIECLNTDQHWVERLSQLVTDRL